jgi:hypothetical protein
VAEALRAAQTPCAIIECIDREAATGDNEPPPSIADAVGGPFGLVETSLPPVAFVVAYTASGQDTHIAVGVALAIGLVLGAIRIVRRESVQQTVAGLVGIGLAAFIATRSGRAEDFFLPGLLANAGYAAAFLVSIAVGRPLVGIILGSLGGEGGGWRDDPARKTAYTRATWLWVGLFLLRLAVQLPLYLAGAVVALGVARTAMGLPLFALGIWLTWRMVRSEHSPN